MYQVYGIKNCNTIKKAIDWLKDHEIEFTFHDFKKEPATEEKLKSWCKQKGWELLLNKKGTTWKTADIIQQEKVVNESSAILFLLEKNSAIKRPIIEKNGQVLIIGFDEKNYASIFNK